MARLTTDRDADVRATGDVGTSKMTRAVNIALGVWLFISAFLWTHTEAQFTNTWLLGVAIAAIAFLTMATPAMRWVNAALAAWLIVSVFVLPTVSNGTFWNNLLVGLVSLIASVVPFATSQRTLRGHGPRTHA